MTDIDHAAEAREFLDHAWHPEGEEERARRDPYLATAQGHATLALAEQQRIANLIALGEQMDYAHSYMGEAPMRDDIKKGLRL